jgi:parvulin-like peptidyl-prolyl isomerase
MLILSLQPNMKQVNLASLTSILQFALIISCLPFHVATATEKPAPTHVLAANSVTQVTYAELLTEMSRYPESDRYEFMLDGKRIAQMIDNILLNKTLAIEARANKLQDLPAAAAEIQNQADKVLAKFRARQVQGQAPKIDYVARARETYLAYPDKSTIPELHEIWHCLITDKGKTDESAKELLTSIRKRILAGESPEDLALKFSEDGSAKTNKGWLGFKNLAELDAAFSAEVRKLKTGEVSQIVKTDFGYHIIQLRGTRPAKRLSFEEVKKPLAEAAEKDYMDGYWTTYLRRVQNDPKLTVDSNAIEAIREKIPTVLPDAVPSSAGTPPAKKN